MANEILDICRNIQDIVNRQPTREDIREIVKKEAQDLIIAHDGACPARQAHSDIKNRLGSVEVKTGTVATKVAVMEGRLLVKSMSPKLLIAIGTIIGAAIPLAISIFSALK